jgi:tripartite ATP-independent transporter DctM subunit
VKRALAVVEDAAASLALLAMMALPLLEIAFRRILGIGIPASGPIVQHLTLWIGFLGAAIAAREGKLLALAGGALIPGARWRLASGIFAAAIGAWVATMLAWGGAELALSERAAGTSLGAGIPTWVAELVLPLGFALIAVRLVGRAGSRAADRVVAAFGIVAGLLMTARPELVEGHAVWPWLTLVAAAGALGAPIFVILGGAAVLLFMAEGVTPATVLVETYALSTSPTLPAIPLFTLAGFLLAEGEASDRLLRVFRAWFGWVPGGTAVVCALLCSFFTVFTGGSGVTILALGGVLFPALLKDGYRERFSLGLMTAAGSLGLLLPPALPLILYAVVAQIPIEDLFIGGIIPGILLTGMIAAWGLREGIVAGARRQPFRLNEALRSLSASKWELAMPIVVLGSMLSGFATAVEAAALVALYALVAQTLVHRDLSFRRDLLRVLTECAIVVGGVLVILGVAVGFTSYLVTAQVPSRLLAWSQLHIRSRVMFLFVLNLFLLAVGWLMEIFAAIVVVVPLIVPLGAAFGVHPVHLGIIFIANLELGFLTPLVGINIFLASYRFRRPVVEVCRAALPMMAILGLGVLLITYIPSLTLGILKMLGRA